MSVPAQQKRAVIYVRISKDRAGAGVGVAEQERLCRAKAGDIGYEVAEVYADNDISAFKKGAKSKRRPGYDRLLGDLRGRRTDAVIAWHTDRLHRDLTELEGYIDACGEGRDGIPTYTVQGGELDLTTSSGRMVARILGAVARQEVEHMIERITASKERNRVNGLRTSGNPPLGYRADERDASGKQIPGVSKGLVIVEDEAAFIRKAYAGLLAGATLYSIAREWSAAGIRTHRGGGTEWSPATVRPVLLRAANAGLIENPVQPPGKGQIVGRAQWEPIVDEDTWRAAKALLMNPERHNGFGRKPSHLLTGLLICGVCGCRSFGVRSCKYGDNQYWRYSCNSLLTRPNDPLSGNHLSVRVAQLEEHVEGLALARATDHDTVAAVLQAEEIDVTALINRRKALEAELDEWQDSGVSARSMARKEAEILPQIEELDRVIASASLVSPAHADLEALAKAETHQEAAKLWRALPLDHKREIIKMFFRFRIHPGKLGRPAPDEPLDIERVEMLAADTDAGAVLDADGQPAYRREKPEPKRERIEAELLSSRDTHNVIGGRLGVSRTTTGKYCAALISRGDLPRCTHVQRADGGIQRKAGHVGWAPPQCSDT